MYSKFLILILITHFALAEASFGQLSKEANDFRKEKKYGQALESYSKAFDSAINDNQKLVCLFFIAEIYHSEQQYEKSIEAFQEVINLTKEQENINHARINTSILRQASAYKHLKKNDKSIELLNFLIKSAHTPASMINTAKKEIENIAKTNGLETPETIETKQEPPPSQKKEAPKETIKKPNLVPKSNDKIYI